VVLVGGRKKIGSWLVDKYIRLNKNVREFDPPPPIAGTLPIHGLPPENSVCAIG
jgi:hypothetical protein